MSGTVTVGSTPIHLNNIDLHAYIVVGDGRAYTAISEVGARTHVYSFQCSLEAVSLALQREGGRVKPPLCPLLTFVDLSDTRASGLGFDASRTNRRAVWMAVCSGAAQQPSRIQSHR